MNTPAMLSDAEAGRVILWSYICATLIVVAFLIWWGRR